MKISQRAALCLICLLGIMPIAASAQPYMISADGSEVTDPQTGLIWRRCPEGMVFSGHTCMGTARTYTHEAALRQATAQASKTAITWRLPNVKELSSIADKNLSNPAIDSTAFPATPSGFFWSASPNAVYSNYAGGVDFADGYVSDGYVGDRGRSGYVRLVRTGQ
jgi:hypothetical protein